MGQRGYFLEAFAVFFQRADEFRHPVFFGLAAHIAPADGIHQADVTDPDPGNAAAEQFRIADQAPHGGIAAIAGTGNTDALRIGVALLDRPVDCIHQIILHPVAPFKAASVEQFAAVAIAATKLRL